MGIVINSNWSKILTSETKKYSDDYYNGRVKAECDDSCEEGCNIDHGMIELVTEYEPLFKSE